MPMLICPDGYPLNTAESRFLSHLLLNDFLREETEKDSRQTGQPSNCVFQDYAFEMTEESWVDLYLATLVRKNWLYDRRDALPEAYANLSRLARLLFALDQRKLTMNEQDLCQMLQLESGQACWGTPQRIPERVEDYLQSQAMTSQLQNWIEHFESHFTRSKVSSDSELFAVRRKVRKLLARPERRKKPRSIAAPA